MGYSQFVYDLMYKNDYQMTARFTATSFRKTLEKHMDRNEVLFAEPYAAAQSLKNDWTRLASTYGCIMVVLSRETLTIRPHWFAKWLISLLSLDLCHKIPITNIRGVTERGKWFSYGKIELHFVTTDGKNQRILLYMKKYQEFIGTVKNAMYK